MKQFYRWVFLFTMVAFCAMAQPKLEVCSIEERFPIVNESASLFLGYPDDTSGTLNTRYVFLHNADSLYFARFAPFGGSNNEPLIIYIKCYYAGVSYTNAPQDYDGFSPLFAGIGGINFGAYFKPDYDEWRSWNGSAWTTANTNLQPRYRSTQIGGNRMSVAIPWSAVLPGGGIPDSVDVVMYQTNGNNGNMFSYAQMPKSLPAGAGNNPSISLAKRIYIKTKHTLFKPYDFKKIDISNTVTKDFLLYNSGTVDLSVSSNITTNPDTYFTSNPPSGGTIEPRKYKRLDVNFTPTQATTTYEAVVTVPNNSSIGNYDFKVRGTGKGTEDVSGTIDGSIIDDISFGENISLSTPVTKTITVLSSGTDTAYFSPYISQGASRFSIVSVGSNVIPPGETTTMVLRFNGSPTEGTFNGQVYMIGYSEGSLRYDLIATVADIAGEPNIEINCNNQILNQNDTIHFPEISVGAFADTTISIQNTGSDTLRITSTDITGSNFSVLTNTASKLPPGSTGQIRIRFFGPVGNHSGSISIVSNAVSINNLTLYFTGQVIPQGAPQSKLEVVQIANNLINTSGQIGLGQLLPKLLLSDNAGIKWYASWDTTNLYVVKIGGNRAEPALIYIKANFPGAVFTDLPTAYDGFQPSFTGPGGINFAAYMKETTVPYDEYRTWNGTLWSAPDFSLQPLFGNQGADITSVRLPWNSITQGNGIPDSIRLVLYQTNGNQAGLFAYGQSPAELPSGLVVHPPIPTWHSKKIILRLPRNSTFSFGNVPLGSTVDTTFLLQNIGDAGSNVAVNGSSTITGAGYSATINSFAGNIPAEKWQHVRVRFSPQALGLQNGSLQVNATYDSPAAPYVVNFAATGVAPPVAGIMAKMGNNLVENGSNQNLGIVEIGTSIDTTIRFKNTGQDTLRISNIQFPLGWSLLSASKPKLAPGDSSAMMVGRDPVTPGINFGTFTFTTNVPGSSPFAFSILLTGDSALSWFPPFPTINDSITISLNTALGNKQLKDSAAVYIHSGIITSGPTGTAWQNVQGSFNVPADSVKLLATGPNTQRIKFLIRDFYNISGNPTVYRLGMVFRNGSGTRVGKTRFDGDFYIPVNPALQTSNIQVRVSGQPLVNQSTINFGVLPVGTTTDTTVWIKNTGNAPLSFSLINVSGFSYQQIGTTPVEIAVGDSASVVIQLNVNGQGELPGFLNLLSNASNAPALLVNLVANGVVSLLPAKDLANLLVYPTPTSDYFVFGGLESDERVNYQIIDLTGKVIRSGVAKPNQPESASGLATGMYSIVFQRRDVNYHLPFIKE